MSQAETGKESSIEILLSVMAMLRDKNYGCPWDLEQSISSLASYTLEEVYEVMDAIENGDMVELEDELGDLLFQVVFYAQIANEDSQFSFASIAETITKKLIRRHPHVFPGGELRNFGNPSSLSTDEVVVNWEAIKETEREEKRQKKLSENSSSLGLCATVDISVGESIPSALDNVPRAMPAVSRAQQLQEKAAGQGFDWQDIDPVIVKIKEEIAELEEALHQGDAKSIYHELGDMLFTLVNLSRHLDIEAEMSLRSANRRFEQRFKWIERELVGRGLKVTEVNLEELDTLWELAKKSGL